MHFGSLTIFTCINIVGQASEIKVQLEQSSTFMPETSGNDTKVVKIVIGRYQKGNQKP